MEPCDLDRLRQLFAPLEWTYAKTMPRWPHWYTVRERWERDEDFVFAVETIRACGFDDEWCGKGARCRTNRALNLDGFKYWTMDRPIDGTIIINRKPIPESPD